MDTNYDVRLFNLKGKKISPELQKRNLDSEDVPSPVRLVQVL